MCCVLRSFFARPSVSVAQVIFSGATTNSDSGVTDIARIYPALREMAASAMPLLVHSEVMRLMYTLCCGPCVGGAGDRPIRGYF